MADRPLRCPECGHTDFYVLSNGVTYRGGTLCEIYRWPEGRDEIATDEEAEVHEPIGRPHTHDHGYTVEQELLQEPELASVEGPVKAFCSACFEDVTESYLQLGRAETLPV